MREVAVCRWTFFRAPGACFTRIPSPTVIVGHQSTNIIAPVKGPEIASTEVFAVPLAVAYGVLEIHSYNIAENTARRKAVSAP